MSLTLRNKTSIMSTATTATVATPQVSCVIRGSVRFGLSDIDQSKTWRSISVYPEDDDVLDALREHLKTDSHTKKLYVTVKVHDKRTDFTSNDTSTSVVDIERHDAIEVSVKPTRWKYDGRSGYSLRASHIILN